MKQESLRTFALLELFEKGPESLRKATEWTASNEFITENFLNEMRRKRLINCKRFGKWGITPKGKKHLEMLRKKKQYELKSKLNRR